MKLVYQPSSNQSFFVKPNFKIKEDQQFYPVQPLYLMLLHQE